MIKTCIIFYKFKPHFEEDEWQEEIDYGRYGDGLNCKSAADIIDQLKKYHKQSTFDFKLTNVVCG